MFPCSCVACRIQRAVKQEARQLRPERITAGKTTCPAQWVRFEFELRYIHFARVPAALISTVNRLLLIRVHKLTCVIQDRRPSRTVFPQSACSLKEDLSQP